MSSRQCLSDSVQIYSAYNIYALYYIVCISVFIYSISTETYIHKYTNTPQLPSFDSARYLIQMSFVPVTFHKIIQDYKQNLSV